MASKVIISLFLAVFMCTADAFTLDDRVDDLLSNLTKALNDSMDKAQNLINTARVTFNAYSQDEVNKAEKVFDELVTKWEKEIEDLKAEAEAANVTIDDCLGTNGTTFDITSEDFDKALEICVNETANEVLVYSQHSLDKIRESLNDISEIKKEVEDCRKQTISVKCLAEEAIKVAAKIAQLPATILKDTSDAVTKIASFDSDVDDCVKAGSTIFGKEGQEEIDEIKKCVESKINQ